MKDEDGVGGGGGVRAVTRALEILMAFDSKRELSAAELLERVDLSKPTLYRLLYTLESFDFIVSEGEPLRFRLGPAIGKLAHSWLSSLDLERSAQGFMKAIWEETRETVALYVPDGKDRLCLYEMSSPEPLSFRRGAGHHDRLWRGASGKAILCGMHLSMDELSRLLDGSGVDPRALADELATIDALGYASSRSEMIQGAVAVAVPFYDRTDRVAGSLVVYGPSTRMTVDVVEKIGERLRTLAADLSRNLGSISPRR